jgi:predicted nucleic acid-binding protein
MCTTPAEPGTIVKYLFDTDTISALFKPAPPKALIQRIETVPLSDQFLSTISILEICSGAYKKENPRKYIDFLEKNVLPRVRVLSFDETAARIGGKIRAGREKNGRPISPFDLQIAAVALSNGCILITGNTRHFEDIPGLEVENWLAEG